MPNLFDTLPDGREVRLVTLRSGELSCEIITYGAALRSLLVPDRDGNARDIVLGFDKIAPYLSHDAHFGAIIGRFGNRIGGAAFDLNGTHYTLPVNDGPNCLHGGPEGFDRQLWSIEEETEDTCLLSYTSAGGEAGFPGTLRVQVRYTLTASALRLDYRAVSDADTLCNLTNHTYFNLAGHDSGPITGQSIRILADAYTPTDDGLIPTGEIAPVEGTPMDLREFTVIGAHIDDDFPALRQGGGYDHNYVLREAGDGAMRLAAQAKCEDSGIALDVETGLPGIQFYAGNSLINCPAGKAGAAYPRRGGFCLETQLFPDAPHHSNFPSALLRAGEEYKSTTLFRFSQ